MGEWKETEIGSLPFDWDMGTFDEDLTVKGRIGWMGYTTSDLVEDGPLVVGGTEIKSRIFLDLQSAQHLRREKYDESPDIQLKDGDVLLVTRGNLGAVGYFHAAYGEATINPSVIILKNFKGDSRFLFYYLVSRQGQSNVLSLSSGSSVPAIYQAHVKELKYPKPRLEEQRLIGDFFYAIDAKIDLLRRQNETLEALAETLFREWFVPARRNDGEGEEEGQKGKLGDVIELVYGKGLKEEIRTGTGFPVVGSSGVVGYHSEYMVEGPGVVIGRKGTLGKVIYLFESFFPIDTTFYVKSKVDSRGLFYEYFLLRTLGFEDFNSDSAVPGLNRDIALATGIRIPSAGKMKEFNNFCESIFQKLNQNNNQIRTLTQLRDTLLPKLMSGEVRVSSDSGGLQQQGTDLL